MTYSFFLYGVYDEDQQCHSRFKEFIVSKDKGYVKGALYQLNCGLSLMSTEGSSLIPGHFVHMEFPETYLSVLDALCGYDMASPKKCFVTRKPVDVFGLESASQQAQAYCLNGEKKISGLRFIGEEHVQPAMFSHTDSLIDKLTERQKTYIQKLAQARGREIVPVDMALYRELMSLELIVDKGRRLALTKLGSEISLFL